MKIKRHVREGFIQHHSNCAGFTLIELLIVIALLGALAVGLIGALDPFEQLKKGTDTGTRDIVNQVQTAVIRYYSVKNAMPWTANPTSNKLDEAPMVAAIQAMADAGELKSDFKDIQAGKLKEVLVTGTGAGAGEEPNVIVCYKPTSKSFKNDPNTKFTIAGVEQPAATCIGQTGGASLDCYWCIK